MISNNNRSAASVSVGILKLLRIPQWVKNCLVFSAIIFGGQLFNLQCLKESSIAFICFCLLSSSVYCLNDVVDLKYDMSDPVKKHRPLPSGLISKTAALMVGCCLAFCSVAISMLLLPASCTAILLVYLVLNILYTLWLKHVSMLDVTIISIGFVLRVVEGGFASDIWISQWIIIMVFLLSLFLALSKRRHELELVASNKKKSARNSVSEYTLPFLDSALSLIGAVVIVSYIIYTLHPSYTTETTSKYLYITALPVLYAIMRYLQLTIVKNRSGDPSSIILKDPAILLSCVVWLGLFIMIIY